MKYTVKKFKGKNKMYHVKLWDTFETVESYENLNTAKRHARKMGHTGEDNPGLTGFPPVAFVTNDNDECVYNPRFKKGKNN